MNRSIALSIAVIGGIASMPASVQAQGINAYSGIPNYNAPQFRPYATTGLSPYLNLTNRPGGNASYGGAAVNYYNFTRPALQAYNPLTNYYSGGGQAMAGAGAQFQPGDDIALDPKDPTDRLPRSPSHPTGFNNYGGYFNSYGSIGSFAPRPVQSTGRPQQTGRR